MPLPSNTTLATLDVAYLGQPFCQVEAKALITTSLDVAYLGQPFVAVGPTGLNVYVRAGGAWKQASAMFVRTAGTWNPVTTVSSRAGGAWKT